MATYYGGTGAAAAERQDLGMLVSTERDKYLGPESRYVAHRMSARLEIPGPGAFMVPKFDNYKAVDGGNYTFRRFIGDAAPFADPSRFDTLNAIPADFGQKSLWDELDPIVRRMLVNPLQGLAAVEALHLDISMARLMEGSDRYLLNYLGSNNGLKNDDATSSDTAAGLVWSNSAADVATDVKNAVVNADLDFDSILLDWTGWQHFKSLESLTDRFGGNVGFGTVSEPQARQAMSSFSKIRPENVFVCDAGMGLSNQAILFQRGGVGPVNPIATPSAIVCAHESTPDANDLGIAVRTSDVDERRHSVYAFCPCDFVARRRAYVRITGIY